MTIHQPNSEIFKLFDRLFLLSEGHMVYQGPATEAIDYFSLRLAKPIPDLMNPP
jgi:ABC-type multidrug transport system ATPase subunit